MAHLSAYDGQLQETIDPAADLEDRIVPRGKHRGLETRFWLVVGSDDK
jgi:hypothetical protein